jgi:CRP-like cAMP-binding protein
MGVLRMAADADLQESLRKYARATVSCKAHDVLFREGDKCRGCFLILEGTLSLRIGTDKKKGLHSTLGPGCLVGLPATVNRHPYSLTCEVVEDANLAFLANRDLAELMRVETPSAIKLLQLLSQEVQSLRYEIAGARG